MRTLQKIMLVDDSEDFLFIFSEVLKCEGFDVFVSDNGSKALNIIDSVNPDLIISDLQMPLMNGWDFIRTIKSSLTYKSLPIIVSSSEPDVEEITRTLGANAYCRKPAALSTMVSLVKDVLSQTITVPQCG